VDELRQPRSPGGRADEATAVVEARGVTKRFGGVTALRDVDLAVVPGSVHALVGENGAGKSTLGKVMVGVLQPDEGEIRVDGRPARMRSPRQALAAGLTAIAQEVAIVPNRSVIENVFLGVEDAQAGFVSRRALLRRYQELDDAVGFGLDPRARTGGLRMADQQKVEILRAIARDARVIVMDEPTAPLAGDETERLLATVRSLAARGTAIVYVSHFLKEVLAIADTVSVLRDGRLVKTAPAARESEESLVEAMLGRSLDVTFPAVPAPAADAPVVCEARGLTRQGAIRDVSFSIRAGEILGLAGLVGSGRSEVARAIFGADPLNGGELLLDGEAVRLRSPRQAVRHGIAMLPESRKEQGLLMGRSVRENITLAHVDAISPGGIVATRRERAQTDRLMAELNIRAESGGARITSLSGGNQQKALFAKWLFRPPRLLIADEPTRGVDVGAKQAIYQLIVGLAGRGMAVLLISSEMEEVLGLSHRVLVMRAGTVVREFEDARAASIDAVMRAAFQTPGVEAA
jgi:ribose transport system ATP-binding protein